MLYRKACERHGSWDAALRAAGFYAVLVGESIVTSGSPDSAVRDLLVP